MSSFSYGVRVLPCFSDCIWRTSGRETHVNSFPEQFLWGAAISAHKVEGGNFDNDWWRWEQRPNRIADNSTSARAADHFGRYEEDIGLARKLGMNALLISIEWSRVHPVADGFDDAAISHYEAVFDACREQEIEPIGVLHEVTQPAWFAAAGGWRNTGAPVHFEHYVNKAAEVLGQRCRYWIPLFEPDFCLHMRHAEGLWPDGLPRRGTSLRHMAEAHVRAYHALHGVRPEAQVGVSLRAGMLLPLDERSAWDVRAARRLMHERHHRFIEAIRREHPGEPPFDFIGLSYYGRQIVRFAPLEFRRRFAQIVDGQGRPCAADRTQADPRSLREALQVLSTHNKPIIVTGNGIATNQDGERCAYLLEHLWLIQQSIADGLDVRGYIHQSFLDGFEWQNGYRTRHGLVHVDWETQARTPNGSAFLYQDICRNGTIRMGTLSKFCPGWRPPGPLED